jgi:glycolate oxidase iron-sulfur subunit
MQTRLSPEFAGTSDGLEAEAILRKCVHCGFCTATCPTYLLLGDELDGPRGRIYLMKQLLEGAKPSARKHPVASGPLPDLPQLRDHLPQRRRNTAGCWTSAARSSTQRVERPTRRASACVGCIEAGHDLAAVRPGDEAGAGGAPAIAGGTEGQGAARRRRTRQVVADARATRARCCCWLGCVQPSMMPNINSATARVLDAAGIQTRGRADEAGCCGAVKFHLTWATIAGGAGRHAAPTSTPGGRWSKG